MSRDTPHSIPIRLDGPRTALRALALLPHAFLFHSSLEVGDARWSFFGADPFFVCRGGDVEARALWREFGAVRADPSRPVEAWDEGPDVPFAGGIVGYWSYDFGRRLERMPTLADDDLGLPDTVLGFYDVTGAYDHATGRAWLFSTGLPASGAARRARAEERLREFAARFETTREAGAVGPPPATDAGDAATIAARCTFMPGDYRRGIERVRDLIARGDIFQANLSQRWSVPLAAMRAPAAGPGGGTVHDTALALFDSLARRSPAPFAGYFDGGDHAIVSASPERFLSLWIGHVETRPIKGTRPRAADPVEDDRLAAELLASAKDRAENVMIVDVLRNDLGRVCETGTVDTPVLCALERYPQVHHLVSTVTGRLRAGRDPFDLLHACFPGGSITGAPKIRAMEILETLEPVRRHIYTGSLGWIGWNGDADWNIAIRTALVTREAVHFAAGGGITADSDADAEYQETLHKAEGMRLALSDVAGVDVVLGDGRAGEARPLPAPARGARR